MKRRPSRGAGAILIDVPAQNAAAAMIQATQMPGTATFWKRCGLATVLSG